MRDTVFDQELERGLGIQTQPGFGGFAWIAAESAVFQQQESISGIQNAAKLVHPVSDVAGVAVQQQDGQTVSIL